ncbi:MAG TPA: recombinase family protein [Mycobacterium sp.]
MTKTFSDTMSGAKDDRPGLDALLDYVREGDTTARRIVEGAAEHRQWQLVAVG